MDYTGVVKGNLIVLEGGVTLPEGTRVEITPILELPKGSPAALLTVWGSDIPDDDWAAVEKAIEDLDRPNREYKRKQLYG